MILYIHGQFAAAAVTAMTAKELVIIVEQHTSVDKTLTL